MAKPIINILVAPEYYEGYRIIPLVAFGIFFAGIIHSFGLVFLYVKKIYILSLIAIVTAFLNVGLNFLLVPRYGYMAAAMTTLISYSVNLFLVIIASRRFLIWKFPFTSLGKAVGVSAVMGIIVYPLGNSLTSSALINLLAAIVSGLIIYPVVLFLLRGFQPNEIEILLNLGRRIFTTKRLS